MVFATHTGIAHTRHNLHAARKTRILVEDGLWQDVLAEDVSAAADLQSTLYPMQNVLPCLHCLFNPQVHLLELFVRVPPLLVLPNVQEHHPFPEAHLLSASMQNVSRRARSGDALEVTVLHFDTKLLCRSLALALERHNIIATHSECHDVLQIPLSARDRYSTRNGL
jgi:hypothetical protein